MFSPACGIRPHRAAVRHTLVGDRDTLRSGHQARSGCVELCLLPGCTVYPGLLARLRPGAPLVTIGDFHPATLSWLGAVAGNPIVPLGVDRLAIGDIPDLYRAYGIDGDTILDAAPRACLTAL
jgi:hypothetical protein